MTPRLPAHLEVGALIRLAQSQGGNAMVLAKGEADAGTILLVILTRGQGGELYERMPDLDGSRAYTRTRVQDEADPSEFSEYLDRRRKQDPDIWIVEVEVDDRPGFRAQLPD